MVLALRLGLGKRGKAGGTWFGRPSSPLPAGAKIPGPARLERARLAMEVLGFCVEAHPLLLEGPAGRRGVTGCGAAASRRGPVRLQGWVIALREVSLGKGESVLFFTLEDETGLVEVVCRKGCRFAGPVEPWAVLQVEGRVEERMGAPAVEARRVRNVGGSLLAGRGRREAGGEGERK